MRYAITIEKKGRKWAQITVHGKMNDYSAKTDIESVTQYDIGDKIEVFGEIENRGNKYHADRYLLIYSEDERKEKESERWWGYVREKIEEGYIYKRGVEELHALGCHDHDEEINAAAKRFREEKDRKKRERDEILASYEEEKRKAKEAEEAKYSRLALPAYNGFRGCPQKGDIITENGRCYEVISSFYNDSDGFSFGAGCEEWYRVKAIDISNTERGRQILDAQAASNAAEREKKEHEKAKANALHKLRKSIIDAGLYEGERRVVNGKMIFDDFNVYGGGEQITIDDDGFIWLIINNGYDGADWSANNIITGGAGAFGFRRRSEEIQDLIDAYLAI